MPEKSKTDKRRRLATRLTRAGRDKSITGPFVNPPVVHASTVLFDSVDSMLHRRQPYVYGRRGTPTSVALENAIADIEDAEGAIICSSGLSAVVTAILSAVAAGDEILIVDSVYSPVRHFADSVLKRLGVATVYYDPLLGGEAVAALMTEKTKAVYVESPGSLTFEMQNLGSIAKAVHARGATVLFDNTWATPAFFRPLEHGADLSIMAATKYIAGHSDVMLGTVAANGTALRNLRETNGAIGGHVGPDDVYLALRGLRTLAVRLARHQESALRIAEWLSARPEVARVLYPPLPSDAGHDLWRRTMTGGTGLLGAVLNGWTDEEAAQFVNSLELFGIGYSWGGFESLAIVTHPNHSRSATKWAAEGPVLRLHIGLEDADDLIADLDAAFAGVRGSA